MVIFFFWIGNCCRLLSWASPIVQCVESQIPYELWLSPGSGGWRTCWVHVDSFPESWWDGEMGERGLGVMHRLSFFLSLVSVHPLKATKKCHSKSNYCFFLPMDYVNCCMRKVFRKFIENAYYEKTLPWFPNFSASKLIHKEQGPTWLCGWHSHPSSLKNILEMCALVPQILMG